MNRLGMIKLSVSILKRLSSRSLHLRERRCIANRVRCFLSDIHPEAEIPLHLLTIDLLNTLSVRLASEDHSVVQLRQSIHLPHLVTLEHRSRHRLMPESIVDEAIRVTVTPTQASYFAGEPFIVNITFTNIRSPETAPTSVALRSASHGHKRSAHSISYAPLSRPPTSPGMSRSAYTPVMPVRGTTKKAGLSRKGLIGRRLSSEDRMNSPSVSFEGRQGLLASKSLSISISPRELQLDVHPDSKGKSPVQNGEFSSNA